MRRNVAILIFLGSLAFGAITGWLLAPLLVPHPQVADIISIHLNVNDVPGEQEPSPRRPTCFDFSRGLRAWCSRPG